METYNTTHLPSDSILHTDLIYFKGVMFTGALLTGNPGSVISLRQLSIRSDRAAEQVGEHHGDAGGCLASGDSGGIPAGATDGGGELAALVQGGGEC